MEANETSPTSANRSRKWRLLTLIVAVVAVGIWIFTRPGSDLAARNSASQNQLRAERIATSDTASNPSESDGVGQEPETVELPQTPVAPEDLNMKQIRAIVPGTWTSQFYGNRYLEIREDGTATIYFQANTFASMFVGSRLKIEYQWAYDRETNRVDFVTLSGRPQASLEYVQKMWGTDQCQTVESLSETEMNLVDLDEVTKHHWTRIDQIPEKIMAPLPE